MKISNEVKKSKEFACPEPSRRVVLLHNVRSRFNVGSIFRTADGAGVNKIYLCGITPAPPHPQIEKVSLGAEKNVPFEKIRSIIPLIKKLRAEGFQIVALEQNKKSVPYSKFVPHKKTALILGTEVSGLPSKILKLSDKIIEIPMLGKKESLNVSVAFGVAVYQIRNHQIRK
jgi:tRNA G18 (ribose-2'-O)-methylase SpoU